jgi:hypothetical protein
MINNLSNQSVSPLETPNLPTSPVRAVMMSGESKTLSEAFKRHYIRVFHTTMNQSLHESISGHADMLVYHMENAEFLVSSDQISLYKELRSLELNPHYLRALIKSPYPCDVLLNAARVGHFLICNLKTVAVEIINAAKLADLEIVDISQGYTKCSICIINSNAIITEDKGIKDACVKRGIDALLISKGSVKLNKQNYGFFGGCTGLIDKNKLATAGNIKYHTDYNRISDFLCKHNIEAVSMADGTLFDIGGILPVLQVKTDT